MKNIFTYTFIAGCLALTACGKKKAPPGNPEVPVNLMTLKLQAVLYYDKFPATTVALSQVNLLPQVQGAVTGIFFKEGSHVEKGQKLYEIDPRIYQDNYNAAVSNEKVAQGNLVQAKQDADRYDYLNKYNAVAKQLYDHAIITLQNAKSSVKSASDAVKTAKTNLGYSIIYAPFSGTIGISQVKLGNVVSVNTTVLNTISTNNPMAVDFVVNEKQLPKFEKLQDNKHPVDSLFTLLLPDNSLYNFTGKLYVIDRAVDAQTGSITVRLVFNNPKDYLRAGMSCVVRVHNQDTAPQMVLPGKAVVEQMGEYFVFVAKDSVLHYDPKAKSDTANKPKLVAQQKKVQVGQTIGANMVIKSGVQEGDKIIVDGVQTLHDGVRITTANKVPPAQGKKK